MLKESILGLLIATCAINAGIEGGHFRKAIKNLKPMQLIEGSPLYNGLPTLAKNHEKLTVLENKRFVNGYSLNKKQAVWTGYRLYNDCRMPYLPRPNFHGDPRVSGSETNNYHFQRNKYDRGHNVPNNAMVRCYGRQAQIDSFAYTNITPQYDYFNRNQWEKVEYELFREAQYARTTNTYIIMGSLYEKESKGQGLLNSKIHLRGIPAPSEQWICRKQGEELGKNIKCWIFYTRMDTKNKMKHWKSIPYPNLMAKIGLEFHWQEK